MDKETRNKIASCKALRGKSVSDLCHMPEFVENLGKYINAQREDRNAIKASYNAMHKLGTTKGFKLPAHVIDRTMEMTVEAFRDEYLLCINGTSKCTSAEREYILQLGMQAYNLTVAEIVTAEFPELKELFYPQTK